MYLFTNATMHLSFMSYSNLTVLRCQNISNFKNTSNLTVYCYLQVQLLANSVIFLSTNQI